MTNDHPDGKTLDTLRQPSRRQVLKGAGAAGALAALSTLHTSLPALAQEDNNDITELLNEFRQVTDAIVRSIETNPPSNIVLEQLVAAYLQGLRKIFDELLDALAAVQPPTLDELRVVFDQTGFWLKAITDLLLKTLPPAGIAR